MGGVEKCRPRKATADKLEFVPISSSHARARNGVPQMLLIFGVRVYRNEPDKRDVAIGMLCMGSLVFIPGAWSTYILYGAMREWSGFRYEQVPSYENSWF